MILYFNKNGQLLQKLEYGSAPRVGMTSFQIFAYFNGLNPNDSHYTNYSVATLRLKRPDLEGSEYPDLFMSHASIVYDRTIGGVNPDVDFVNGTRYYGFVFDFSKIRDNEGTVKLLDTPGMWKGTITLLNNNTGDMVTGLVEFNVEGAVSDADDEALDLDYSAVQNNTADLLQDYALKTQTIITVTDIGDITPENYTDGQIIYAETQGLYYKINSEAEDGYELFEDKGILNDSGIKEYYIPYTGALHDINLGSNQLLLGNCYIYGDGDTLYIDGEEIYLNGGYFDLRFERGNVDVGDNGLTFNNGDVNFENNVYFLGVAYYNGSELATKDDIAALGTVYKQKGSKTVAQLNYASLYKEAGDVYNVLDSGTLTNGNVEVLAGDNVVWTANGVWDKLSATIDLSPYAKTEDLPNAVLSNQATTTLITNPTTNANGWVLSNYESADVNITPDPNHPETTFDCVKITRGGNNLTEAQAITYMEAMTGSKFLPKFNFQKPSMSLFVDKDGNAYKPQWDSTNGLLLYKLGKLGGGDSSTVEIKSKKLTLKWIMPTYQIESNSETIDCDVSYHFVKKVSKGEEARLVKICNDAGGSVTDLDGVAQFLIAAVTSSASQKDTLAFLSYAIGWDSVESRYIEQGVMAEPWVAKGPLFCHSFGLNYQYKMTMVSEMAQLVQIPTNSADSNSATFQYTIDELVEDEFEVGGGSSESQRFVKMTVTNVNQSLEEQEDKLYDLELYVSEKTFNEQLSVASASLGVTVNFDNISSVFAAASNTQKGACMCLLTKDYYSYPLVLNARVRDHMGNSWTTGVCTVTENTSQGVSAYFGYITSGIHQIVWNHLDRSDAGYSASSTLTCEYVTGIPVGGSGGNAVEELEDIENQTDFVGVVMCKIDIHCEITGEAPRVFSIKTIGSEKSNYKTLDNAFGQLRSGGLAIPEVKDATSFTNALNIVYTASPLYFAQALILFMQDSYMTVGRTFSQGTYDYTVLNGDDAQLWYINSLGTAANLTTQISNEVSTYDNIWGRVND